MGLELLDRFRVGARWVQVLCVSRSVRIMKMLELHPNPLRSGSEVKRFLMDARWSAVVCAACDGIGCVLCVGRLRLY